MPQETNEIVNEVDDTVIKNDKKNRHLNSFVDYVELFVIAICIVILFFSILFRTCTVDGDSMNMTLSDGETLLVSDLFYTPKRQDVIVFHNNDTTPYSQHNKPLVKRVIGIEGDTVIIDYRSNKITVITKSNETIVLDEQYLYLDPSLSDPAVSTSTYVVPEGTVFVLGDNRRDSLDSRYSSVGFVDERSILGKVYFRVAPLSRFGTVK